MCTRAFINIRPVNPNGRRFAFVPCGKCFDCQTLQRNEWSTRLRLHIDSLTNKNDYWGGFCTLTFNDSTIPRVPRVLYKNPRAFSYDNFCFDKSIGQRFCRSFRDHLRKKYSLVKPIYLFCSEYGDTTDRPHHHFFVFLPKKVDAREIFDYIVRKWRKYGFVFPKDFRGGTDSNNYYHKPFVVDNLYKTVSYVCKYVTKSIVFEERFNSKEFWHETKNRKICLSNCRPYHIQTRSLAQNWLDCASDDKKKAVLKSGFFFVGYDKKVPCPLYIRRKLLFVNDYKKEESKRLVRRRPSDFFLKNAEYVLNLTVANKEKLYAQIMSWYYTISDSTNFSPKVQSAFSYLSAWTPRVLGLFDALYFGYDWCFSTVNKDSAQWVASFDWRGGAFNVDDITLINYDFFCDFIEKLYLIQSFYIEQTRHSCVQKAALERKVKRLKELRYRIGK